jgi:hypothetical protein
MLARNTRESALRREDFHHALRQWLDDSFDGCAGDATDHAGPAWLWVRHGGAHYYLTAGATRAGIREYMNEVTASAGDPEWSLQSSAPGVRDRVAVGPQRRIIDGFDFYRHVPGR